MSNRHFLTGTTDPANVTITRIRDNPNHLEIRWTQGGARLMRHVVLSFTQEIKPEPINGGSFTPGIGGQA